MAKNTKTKTARKPAQRKQKPGKMIEFYFPNGEDGMLTEGVNCNKIEIMTMGSNVLSFTIYYSDGHSSMFAGIPFQLTTPADYFD